MSLILQLVTVVAICALCVYVIFRLRVIHDLVNSRLSEALREIRRLGGHDENF